MKKSILRLCIAVSAVAIGWSIGDLRKEYISLTRTPDRTMVVTAIKIPDFSEGEDPPVVYDRDVVRRFTANWFVKIYPVGGIVSACTEGSRSVYEPDSDVSGNTLSWYVGKECGLKPGSYVAKTTWVTDDDVVIKNTSNIFKVTAKKAIFSG